MTSAPRFTLIMTLRDNHNFEPPLSIAIGVDHEVKISNRAVDEMKAGADFGIPLMSFAQVVQMMRIKEFRRDLFTQAATMLGASLAERMEDAEGWHDASRIDPARRELRGEQSCPSPLHPNNPLRFKHRNTE